MISDFRTSIKDTNVVLNPNISPGLLIIPNSLIILKDSIPGYNNYLTTSTLDMRFGRNTTLNKVVEKKDTYTHSENSKPNFSSNKKRYKGPLLGATGNEGDDNSNTSDNEKKSDNTLIYTILTFVAGIFIVEVVISGDGFKLNARTK